MIGSPESTGRDGCCGHIPTYIRPSCG